MTSEMKNKVINLEERQQIVLEKRTKVFSNAHCHGVFDLVNPGHIRHLKATSYSTRGGRRSRRRRRRRRRTRTRMRTMLIRVPLKGRGRTRKMMALTTPTALTSLTTSPALVLIHPLMTRRRKWRRSTTAASSRSEWSKV